MRLLNYQDKKLQGVVFSLWLPLSFQPSLSTKMQTQLREKFKMRRGSSISLGDLFRKKMLSGFEVKNEQELLKKYPKIRNSLNKNIKYELLQELGIEQREFSKVAQIWGQEMLNGKF